MNINERYSELIDSYRKEKNFQRQYNEGFRYLLEPYGLSVMEADLLFAIYLNPQCDSITKLCADIGKTKGVISKACDHLCKEKYLSSKNDEVDRRVIHFKITAATRSLITTLSRYMESMEYIHKAKTGECLLSGRLDRKKALFYLIKEEDSPNNAYSYLPFCSYESFLNKKCLPRLHPEEREENKESLSLAAIEEELCRKEKFETVRQMRFHHIFRSVVFSAEIIPNSNDAALLRIQKE